MESIVERMEIKRQNDGSVLNEFIEHLEQCPLPTAWKTEYLDIVKKKAGCGQWSIAPHYLQILDDNWDLAIDCHKGEVIVRLEDQDNMDVIAVIVTDYQRIERRKTTTEEDGDLYLHCSTVDERYRLDAQGNFQSGLVVREHRREVNFRKYPFAKEDQFEPEDEHQEILQIFQTEDLPIVMKVEKRTKENRELIGRGYYQLQDPISLEKAMNFDLESALKTQLTEEEYEERMPLGIRIRKAFLDLKKGNPKTFQKIR